MKHSSLLVPFAIAGLAGLVASSNGVAEEQNRDRTGAPGSHPVCTSCHNSAGASVTAAFEVLDWNTEEMVTEYMPGQDYIVRMVVVGGDASMDYGMQSTVVLTDGSNAGSFGSVSTNAQLDDVGGRHIVEHNAPSSSNSFDVTWTAPAAGSGDADFYMSALAVNGNGTTGGDTYVGATFTLPEAGGTAIEETLSQGWARPSFLSGDTWTWTAPVRGRLVVSDLAGRVIRATNVASEQRIEWSTSGIQIVNFVGENGIQESWKLGAR